MFKRFLTATFAIAALSGATATFAKNTAPETKPKQVTAEAQAKKLAASAAQRRQIAQDLHWRGSNIPPAVTASKNWQR
jgi:signal transduction histidine kinase